MNNDKITTHTIGIYLQIAETAMFSKDLSLAKSMLLAAYEQVREFSQIIDRKMLISLAELLLLGKLTKQAEEIFNLVLKTSKDNDDIWLRAKVYDGLTEIYIRQSEFEKARKKCEQAIRILNKLSGFDPVLLLSRKRKLALINLHQGKNCNAHDLFP